MKQPPPLAVALIEPEIPPNTGNIARFCAATYCHLDLVEPLGFSLDEKHLKRAGMDYWKHVCYRLWPDRDSYFDHLKTSERRFYLFTTKAERSYTEAFYRKGDTLIFGRESKGLPESILGRHPERSLTIPMANPSARSLNLSTAAAIVTFEALRQIGSHSHPS